MGMLSRALRWAGAVALPTAAIGAGPATSPSGEDSLSTATAQERVSLHFQATATPQAHPEFHADYSGPNSLRKTAEIRASYSSTLFLGAKLWEGGEVYADPEMFGGKALSQGFGVAGFPNGDLNRVSTSHPTVYLARVFYRQTIGLGPEKEQQDKEQIDPDQNQLAKSVAVSRLTLTVGKFSAADIFDANAYAHDPRSQFLNWGLFDNGAWDYPADVRGYTWGGAIELNQPKWALRYGVFMEPDVASGAHFDFHLDKAFGQALEYERRYSIGGQAGVLRLLAFLNRAHMGAYREAAEMARPDITLTRRYSTKYGFGINIEQQLTHDVGIFVRLGWNDGRREDWAFTEIDRTASVGISVKGTPWARADDVAGVAGLLNGLSSGHRRYLAAGGVGFIIGDGTLTYDAEEIVEAYYSAKISRHLYLSADAQFLNHPAYNRDRGPSVVLGLRLHFQI